MKTLAFAGSLVLVLAVAAGALADDGQPAESASGPSASAPATSSAPSSVGSAGGSTTVVAPPGSAGVTVVVPTAGGGTVTASGCSSVVVNGAPTMVTSTGAPCPLPAYQPYEASSASSSKLAPPSARPLYAADPDRRAALIGSSIGFGVGAATSGIAYLIEWGSQSARCSVEYAPPPAEPTGAPGGYYEAPANCSRGGARVALLTYGAIVGFVPSIPRFVVGDTTRGLVYSGLRAASVGVAAFVDWKSSGESAWTGPFLLGFAAPITLGIIDLATTPHREDLERRVAKPGIGSISPVAVTDRAGKTTGAMLSVGGLF